MKKQAVLSLSGGMDSSTLLLRLLADGYEVTALSFDYGQKHNVELERAQSLVDYLCNNDIGIANILRYRQIKLDGLVDLLDSALVTGGADVPEGHYAEENMKATVVPNRNKIFSSLIQAVALSIAEQKNTECAIAMGIHAGDHAIYMDCRQEFRDADFEAFKLGNWGAEKVVFYTPYLDTDKFGILEDGVVCCKTLGLDFNEVYSRTNTSYKPIKINNKWYSDYKSASSVERVEAFIKLGRPDSAEYADENGPVTWEHVVNEVTKVLENHGN
jgi:7-cyano-7-deazaguanine synthase